MIVVNENIAKPNEIIMISHLAQFLPLERDKNGIRIIAEITIRAIPEYIGKSFIIKGKSVTVFETTLEIWFRTFVISREESPRLIRMPMEMTVTPMTKKNALMR